jgi:hypothetical protein
VRRAQVDEQGSLDRAQWRHMQVVGDARTSPAFSGGSSADVKGVSRPAGGKRFEPRERGQETIEQWIVALQLEDEAPAGTDEQSSAH